MKNRKKKERIKTKGKRVKDGGLEIEQQEEKDDEE